MPVLAGEACTPCRRAFAGLGSLMQTSMRPWPAGKTGCGGSVLRCLSNFTRWNGVQALQSEECEKEVQFYLRMRVRSFQ